MTEPEESFEWNSLEARHTLTGHTKRITCLVHVSNGTLVSGSADGTLRVWSTSTGQCHATLDGHQGGVVCLTQLERLSAHPRVLSGGVDGTLRVWSVAACGGTELAVLEGHTGSVYCIKEKADGGIISGGSDGSVMLWKLTEEDPLGGTPGGTRGGNGGDDVALFCECLAVLKGHTEPIFAVFELGEGSIVSASADHTLRLWSAADEAAESNKRVSAPGTVPCSRGIPQYKCVSVLAGHTDAVWCAAPIGNGRLVSGSADGNLRLWNTKPTKNGNSTAGKCSSKVLEGHTNAVWGLAPLHDGLIASGSVDTSVQLWLVAGDYPPSRSRASMQAGQRGVQCLTEVCGESQKEPVLYTLTGTDY